MRAPKTLYLKAFQCLKIVLTKTRLLKHDLHFHGNRCDVRHLLHKETLLFKGANFHRQRLRFESASSERKSRSFSVSRRGGRNKGGRKQMRANASKRRQTRTNASKRRGANASKRKQTRANVDKRKQTLAPPFIAVFTPPFAIPLLSAEFSCDFAPCDGKPPRLRLAWVAKAHGIADLHRAIW